MASLPSAAVHCVRSFSSPPSPAPRHALATASVLSTRARQQQRGAAVVATALGDMRPTIDENPEGVLSGEWPDNFSLISYEDLRKYLESRIVSTDKMSPTDKVFTFLFVFTGVAAAMAAGVPEVPGAAMPIASLAGVALAQALAAGVLVTAGFHVSGGHLNPAVTLALLARGHITAFRSVLYVVAQLLASSLACILLRYLTGGQEMLSWLAAHLSYEFLHGGCGIFCCCRHTGWRHRCLAARQ